MLLSYGSVLYVVTLCCTLQVSRFYSQPARVLMQLARIVCMLYRISDFKSLPAEYVNQPEALYGVYIMCYIVFQEALQPGSTKNGYYCQELLHSGFTQVCI